MGCGSPGAIDDAKANELGTTRSGAWGWGWHMADKDGDDAWWTMGKVLEGWG